MITTALKPKRSNSDILFYILSGVVSLVGINIKFGVTLYLPRLFMALFLIGLLIKLSLRGPNYRLYINKSVAIFVALPSRRSQPVTSRKASSMLSGSMRGEKFSKILKICSLTSR